MKSASLAGLALAGLLLVAGASLARADQPISAAEKQLFLAPHLGNVNGTMTLHYDYTRSGSAQRPFQDQVKVEVGAEGSPELLKAHVVFLSGDNALTLADVEGVSANPVILSFLERDVREMQRLTKGQANYFRKRLRLALANTASVSDTTVALAGRQIPALRIVVTPYADDPMRPRFERLADKHYEFVLSEGVPGWVYELRTTVNDTVGGTLIREVLRYKGNAP